jgi:hypothetical protein
MRRFALVASLLLLPVALSASPVTFNNSWDGNPPGTFADIVGSGAFDAGLPDFQAGMWLITVDGGFSAWYGVDVIGFEGCPTAASPCVLGKPTAVSPHPTVLQVYQDRPWHLWATTPSYTHLTSNGPQFAFQQTSATTWRYGLEDIALGASDNDYQDLFGTLQFLHGPPIPTPTPECVNCDPPVSAVPEPGTILLTLGGLAFVRKVRR